MNKYLDRYIPIVTLLLGCGEVANHSSAFNLRGGTEGFEYLVCGVAGHAHHEPSTRLSIAHDVLKMLWNVLIKQEKEYKGRKKKKSVRKKKTGRREREVPYHRLRDRRAIGDCSWSHQE